MRRRNRPAIEIASGGKYVEAADHAVACRRGVFEAKRDDLNSLSHMLRAMGCALPAPDMSDAANWINAADGDLDAARRCLVDSAECRCGCPEHFHPDRNHPDPVIARRSRRRNLLPDERTPARRAGDCFRRFAPRNDRFGWAFPLTVKKL